MRKREKLTFWFCSDTKFKCNFCVCGNIPDISHNLAAFLIFFIEKESGKMKQLRYKNMYPVITKDNIYQLSPKNHLLGILAI